MIPKNPIAVLPTHEVVNTPPHLGDQDLWGDDAPLQEWVASQGAGGLRDRLAISGKRFGGAEVFEKADQANRFPPQLKAFDRYGMRVDQIEYHPAYHDLMALAIENEVPSFAWRNDVPGAAVASTGTASARRRRFLKRWSASVALVTSKIRSCRGFTGKRRSTVSGKDRATSCASTFCAQSGANPRRFRHCSQN